MDEKAPPPVDDASKRSKFKPDEAIPAPYAGDKLLKNNNTTTVNKPRPAPLRSRSPDCGGGGSFKRSGSSGKLYRSHQQCSPVLEVKSRFTFGTSECLSKISTAETQQQEAPLISPQSSNASFLPKSVPFGRSRRMSRSLPELRDLQFVSVLPDVAEGEESETSSYEEEVVYQKPAHRTPWHRKLDFLWCSVCHALGFANMWRFPYYCYSNGGGSFTWPYLAFMLICSVPFLCMELAIGQLTQSGPISAFGQLCPLMKGIGVASMMLSFWVTAYYSVLTSWTLFYSFNSFYSPPRWTRCTNTWNTDSCRDHIDAKAAEVMSTVTSAAAASRNEAVTESLLASAINSSSAILGSDHLNSSLLSLAKTDVNATHPAVEFLNIKMLEKTNDINESGEVRFELMASVLFVWILTYIALRKTDFFRGTTIYVLTVVSYVLLFSIFLRTVALEGGKIGLKFLFQPDWDKMFSPRVLMYALAQAFHSLGVVLGPSILMGSCHKQHNNLLRDTIVLTAVTLLTVLIIGCITFATVGHLAFKMNKPFWTVLSDDPGSVFVLYSIVIGSMPLPSCWGVFFFFVLLFLGLDSEIKLMATLVSALKEAYTFYIKQRFMNHSVFLAVICGFCFAASIPYLIQAGIFFFQLIDHYTAVIATIIVALFEVCALGLLYGTANLSSCIQQMTGKTPSYFYQFSWMILSPVTILAILIYWCIKASDTFIKRDYIYPQWAHIVGWILFGLTVCWIPFLAVAAYRKTPDGDIMQKLRSTIEPRFRSNSQCKWEPKPVIILNGSTVTASEFPDYKLPELPAVPNAVQSYVEKHSVMRQNDETVF